MCRYMKEYPKNRKGSEYYPSRCNEFATDSAGKEFYARDFSGNEFYPKKRKTNLFARNEIGIRYYAKDKNGNEFYPLRDNCSVLIEDPETKLFVLAMYADGKQRYPVDKKGNEYYLKLENSPILLRSADGSHYLARSRRGHPFIPWNHVGDYLKTDDPHIYTKDGIGNGVYCNEKHLPEKMQKLLQCLCDTLVICPPLTALIAFLI